MSETETKLDKNVQFRTFLDFYLITSKRFYEHYIVSKCIFGCMSFFNENGTLVLLFYFIFLLKFFSSGGLFSCNDFIYYKFLWYTNCEHMKVRMQNVYMATAHSKQIVCIAYADTKCCLLVKWLKVQRNILPFDTECIYQFVNWCVCVCPQSL